MRKLTILILVVFLTTSQASALQIPPPAAPDSVSDMIPAEPETFAQGLWQLVKAVISRLRPDLTEACGVCLSVIAASLLTGLLESMTGKGKKISELICTLSMGTILLRPAKSFISLGVRTVEEMTAYGKLLLPVMTAGLSAQGGITKSAALYTGTAVFNTILSGLVSAVLIPMVYIFLALSIANSAVGEQALKKIRDLIKWCATWVLKGGLYIFTGYMSLTGVITGSADAAALKVTKTTISTIVPVIGGILTEASETVLVGAGIVKNAAGVYGLLAILALCLEPFARIGLHFLLLKATGAVCAVVATKQATELVDDFSAAMGMLVAVIGSICLMLLISIVCFMKGVG